MITLKDIFERLKNENFNVTHDDDAIFIDLDEMWVLMFINCDDDENEDRISMVQYSLFYKGYDDNISYQEYSEYDRHTKKYSDLDFDVIIENLKHFVDSSVRFKNSVNKISNFIDEIAKEIEEYEIPEDFVANMFAKKIDFY
jgi:hypothetical protein